jgi:hypothetical protein
MRMQFNFLQALAEPELLLADVRTLHSYAQDTEQTLHCFSVCMRCAPSNACRWLDQQMQTVKHLQGDGLCMYHIRTSNIYSWGQVQLPV